MPDWILARLRRWTAEFCTVGPLTGGNAALQAGNSSA